MSSLVPRAEMRAVAAVLAAAAMTICLASVDPAGAAVTTVHSGAGRSWTVYHGDYRGTGIAAGVTAVDTAHRAWTSPTLDGQLFGEPLVFGRRIYVATENDTVYALSAATGAVEWSTHVGMPVPAGALPCGDISPTVGITGTPVIDPARKEIFVVADELRDGRPAHVLVGLSAASGRREMSRDVDPHGANPAALLQRTGLTLDRGRVIFGFGGNYGDCASYRGRVVAVPESGGKPTYFTVDAARGESQGAVWLGGAAPAVDSGGDVWVSTGNGSVYSRNHAYDDSDGVLELSPSLRLRQFFAPRNWPANNSQDLDMSTEPVLLRDGQVILAGKSRLVYLLNGAQLGGIGSQQAQLGPVCGGEIDGGSAETGTTIYLPCTSGIIAIRATKSPSALHLLWSSGIGGGPPVLAAGLVWTIGQDGTLYGLNPRTGKVRQQAKLGVPANHFPTPSVGDGLLLATCAQNVVAFRASGPGAAGTVSPSAASAARADCQYSPPAPPLPKRKIAEAALAAVAVIVAAGLIFMRERSRRRRAR